MAPTPPPCRARPKGKALRRWLAAAFGLIAVTAINANAQDIFFTQSGGRGLQNAKMSARVSKVEGDTKDLQDEMAKIQPFAKKPIISCTNTGDKLRWTGNDWLCDSETDPTVQGFAKKALPSCGAGQILSASGSDFNCVTSGFLSAEADPTVQGFAKAPLPNCGTGQVLSANGDGLTCIVDESGLTQEADPYVHSFARTDAATIHNCEAGKVLTMTGNRLECVFDAVGITVETDPKVQPFAKNDIPGYSLAACPAGDVVTAVDQAGVTILKCEQGSAIVGPVISATKLDDLADVDASSPNAEEVLRFVGGTWVNSDDRIGAASNTKWCHFTATEIVCDRDIPAPMPANACDVDELVQWDGTQWSCADIGSTVGSAISLGQLHDVTITAPIDGQGLTYDNGGWVNGYNSRIARYDTDVRVADSSGGNGFAQIVVDGTGLLTAINGRIGIGTNTPSETFHVLHNGAHGLRFGDAGLRYFYGNEVTARWRLESNGFGPIYSGLFFEGNGAQQGHAAIGIVDGSSRALGFATDSGSGLVTEKMRIAASGNVGIGVTNPTAKLEVNGDISATNLRLSGNLYVSGSQSFDGVTFANGGISATGTISATRFYGDGSGLTGLAGGDIILSGTTFAQATEDESITFVTNGQQRAVIGSNGNVGIGTDDPSTVLHVMDVTNGGTGWNLRYSGMTNGNRLAWYNGPNLQTWITGNSNLNQAELKTFTTRLSLGVGNDDLTILSGGNIGVGTVLPNAKLDVYGTVSATNFVGNGSQLTGIQKDRIVSGTSNVTVAEDGSVTITTAGGQRLVIGNTLANALDVNGYLNVGAGGFTAASLRMGGANTGFSAAASYRLDTIAEGVQLSTYDNRGGTNPTFAVWGSANVNSLLLGNYAADTVLSRHAAGIVAITNGTAGQYRDLWARSISATDLRLSGNLYVSGSQSIDGVVFANGGVSATGVVTATAFYGDGSGLTGLMAAASPSGAVQFSRGDGSLGGDATNFRWDNATKRLTLSGDNFFPLVVNSTAGGSQMQLNDVANGSVFNLVSLDGFGIYNQSGLNQYALWINKPNNNVGIGTSNPGTTLDVSGSLRAQNGNITLGHWVMDSDSGQTDEFHHFYNPNLQIKIVNAGGGNAHVGLGARANDVMDLVVHESGNVGIGTAGPQARLDISGSGPGTLAMLATAGVAPYNRIMDLVETANSSAVLRLYSNASYPVYLNSNGASFLNGGNVGIGTTNPNAKLDVSGSIKADGVDTLYGIGGLLNDFAIYNKTNNTGYIRFITQAGGQQAERVRITNAGDVGIGTENPNANLDVYGTISATNFVGDGSGLTGVIAGSSDRIVSGSAGGTRMVAISESGYISITQAGANAGWFDPYRGLVTLGVSATGGLSGTTGYFSGNVEIGHDGVEQGSSRRLTFTGLGASGQEQNAYFELDSYGNYGQALDFHTPGLSGKIRLSGDMVELGRLSFSSYAAPLIFNYNTGAGLTYQNGYVQTTGTLFRILNSGAEMLTLLPDGRMGLSNINPAATLQVSGSFIVSTSAQTTTPSLYVGTNGKVGIGTSSPDANLHIASTAYATLRLRDSYGHGVDVGAFGPYGPGLGTYYDGNQTAYLAYDAALGGGLKFLYGTRNNDVDHASYPATLEFAPKGYVGTRTALFLDNLGRVGIATVTPTTALEVNGTISATSFVGDGSGLTGIGQGDRITSGTSRVIASEDRSVTISTAGSARVTVGENGFVGIGTAAPEVPLEVRRASDFGWSVAIFGNGANIAAVSDKGRLTLGQYPGNAAMLDIRGIDWNNGNAGVDALVLRQNSTNAYFVAKHSGRIGIGIGTAEPSATLEISGTMKLAGGNGGCAAVADIGRIFVDPSSKKLMLCRQ